MAIQYFSNDKLLATWFYNGERTILQMEVTESDFWWRDGEVVFADDGQAWLTAAEWLQEMPDPTWVPIRLH